MKERTVTHLNIIGFRAAVAEIKDKHLCGRPFVIAGATGGRCLALDCSPEAVRQGVTPGTALALAERKIKDLLILSPDPPAYDLMNKELEKVAERYAPLWENDKQGNLYLDITGTTSIFGRSVDCSSRILRDIYERLDIRPAVAVASNKLVSKVATRSIRPMGLIQVLNGTEEDFLSHQDVRLLPGMGKKLLTTAAVVGIKEIGEIACLSQSNAIALFGKHGAMLRDMALGIDSTPVVGKNGRQKIVQQADFNEDVIDDFVIQGAILSLAEHGGLQMRNEKSGTRNLQLTLVYSDGVEAHGFEKTKRLLVTDNEIKLTAYNVYKKIANRRIRIRSIKLVFDELTPLGYQPDLFEPETEIKERHLQEALDKIQNRFGAGKITRGIVLAACSKKAVTPLLNRLPNKK